MGGSLAGSLPILAFLAPLATAATLDPVPAPIALGSGGSHDLCGVEVPVGYGRFHTTEDSGDFSPRVGLWVGGRADRGAGPVASVSTGLYGFEFWPEDDPSPTGRAGQVVLSETAVQAVYVDTFTSSWLPDHLPLGLEVIQESVPVEAPEGVHAVEVKFTIRNISDEYDPPGWTIEGLYVGLFSDADIGRDMLHYWADDLGGFVPGPPNTGGSIAPGARNGDLAYMYDEPGNGDDVDTQFGISLRNVSAHAFRIWHHLDPTTDAARYALLRGNSDTDPTIDPNPLVATDHRFLISAGPYPTLAPGETITFSAALLCGRLVLLPAVAPDTFDTFPRPSDHVVSLDASSLRLGDGVSDVEVYSVSGRRLTNVLAGRAWDLRLASGERVPAGVYFWRPAGRPGAAGKIVVRR